MAVQTLKDVEETRWLSGIAEQHYFIHGIVGWLDLCAENLTEQLDEFCTFRKFRGVCHALDENEELSLTPKFLDGIEQLREYELRCDLLVFPKHLPTVVRLADEFPEQPFVLAHMGRPPIAERRTVPWRNEIEAVAAHPNVYCKLSGVVFGADGPRSDGVYRFLDIAFDAFGPERLMIGSDPARRGFTDVQIVQGFVRNFRPDIQSEILGGTCAYFYGIGGESNSACSPSNKLRCK